MLFFLLTFLSFSFFFYQDLISNSNLIKAKFLNSSMSTKKKWVNNRVENVDESAECPILDLPELTLELILSKLPPEGLCAMAGVCTELRAKCRSDYLWERHLREKWGQVVGPAAKREWKSYLASKKTFELSSFGGSLGRQRKWISCVWPFSWIRSRIGTTDKAKGIVPDDSVMSWYLSLESGKFWFPAQVYNREHGHVGFMLSCYDAEVSYDRHSGTFNARYPPHGRRTIVQEEGMSWERVRAPPVGTPAHDLHSSDCLKDLQPGDHIEIQWRRNTDFPYGWWYGVVGHLESCDGNAHFCRCHLSDTVVLEFNQYTVGSRWRQTTICRKSHREKGNETDGFYGGVRRLQGNDEIAKWRQLWPLDILE
ncbi:F-box protein [Rhynchospora pubera]|uniref:F-box protein n=1 Tax=Rhynchospora pubera TaxID=906938 RepID=A0AAV8EYS1_9POAL|nr:F-box protein [Rhynchospora pubera]